MTRLECLSKIGNLQKEIQKIVNEYAEYTCPFKRNEIIKFIDFSKNKKEKREGIILEIFGRLKDNDIGWWIIGITKNSTAYLFEFSEFEYIGDKKNKDV